jgi:TonB family protein
MPAKRPLFAPTATLTILTATGISEAGFTRLSTIAVFTTDIYGRVAAVKVLKTAGSLLDEAAIDAVKQWIFEPMIIDGKPKPVVFTVTSRFKLK